jgi:hypothetical protein
MKRSDNEYLRDKQRGEYAEADFACRLAAMGGTATKIAKIPNVFQPSGKPGPRFMGPADNDDGFKSFKAPDFIITLPQLPYGSSIYAEVKLKRLYTNPKKESAFIYLDEVEKKAMEDAGQHLPTIFVIRCPDLEEVDGYGEWLWVDIGELSPDRVKLPSKRSNGKRTFLLPIDLFRPLSTLKSQEFDYAPHPPAIQPPQAGYRNHREGSAREAAP